MGGSGELKLAAEELTGIKVDRYLYTAEKGFKTVLRTLGNGLVLNVPSKIDYRGEDFTLLPPARGANAQRGHPAEMGQIYRRRAAGTAGSAGADAVRSV